MKPQEIISLLQSPEYADFLRGNEELSRMRSVPEILSFHRLVEESESDHLRSVFQKQLFRLFSSDLMELNALAMQLLLEQATLEQKELRSGVLQLLEEFLGGDNFSYFKKLISFRRSFRSLSPRARTVATRLIGTYQLREAYTLLLDNFLSKDTDLIALTIEVFRRSKDARANRYLRAIISEEEDEKLALLALQALSELGNFFDLGRFRKLLRSPKPLLQRAALRGLHRLRGAKAMGLLEKEFLQSKDLHHRGFILDLLESGAGIPEVELLIRLWNAKISESEDRKIEGILGELEGQKKLGPILGAFDRAPESLKHKLIILLNEVSSQRCYEFYKRSLFKEKNDFLLISIMEAMAYYDRPESIPLLRSFMRDPESFLHYYAFSSIVRHNCLDLTEILEEVALLKLPDDRHHHQLILSVLAHQKSLTTLTTFLQAYVLLMLRSNRAENRYLAYRVVGKFYLLFELKGIFDIFAEERSELVIEESLRVFGEIFGRAPQAFMEANPPQSIFDSSAFIEGIQTTPSLLLSLFSSKEEKLTRALAKIHPLQFRRSLLEIAEADLLEGDVLDWADLTQLSFREFQLLWEKFPDNPKAKTTLLGAIENGGSAKFGEFILEEYLQRGGEEIIPFVSRYVGGLA